MESSSVAEIEGEITISRLRQRSFKGRTHEAALTDELHFAKVGFYKPEYLERRREGGRIRLRPRKLFPYRIFIGSGQTGRDVADRNHRASGHEIIPESSQSRLRQQLIQIEQRLSKPADQFPALQPGTSVCVTDGPLRYQEGIIESRDKGNRFVVRMMLLGNSTPVELAAEQLEVIDVA